MPIYEYICPGVRTPEELPTSKTVHVFEKIIPMSQMDEKQECPTHSGNMCERKEVSRNSWVWGQEDVAWDAGLSSNPIGMSRRK